MSSSSVIFRKQQAERELAATDVSRAVVWVLVSLFLATLMAVPLAEEWVRFRSIAAGDQPEPLALVELLPAVAEAARAAVREGPVAADLRLLESIDRAETRLEERSFLREWLLPGVQGRLLAWVGLGNEQVYAGREGWLFYRADVDHVIGPGFLEPRVLRGRARGGDAWQEPPQPDPLVALIELERDLAARGIDLIVVPTPVKPTVHPESFSRRASGERRTAMRNPSFGRFVEELREAGLSLFDPSAILIAASSADEAAYLRTDTHWTPAAMERVAQALAAKLLDRYDLGPESLTYHERAVTIQDHGDLMTMLQLPEDQRVLPSERVEVRTVIDPTGASWRARSDAAVLLLGDSFTNVFSDARLGWGASAGLAERLAFNLRRPIDRIAVNAGGAHASREALARDLRGGSDRLAGKLVVVYQFATRELSQGDWRPVALSP